MWKCFAVVLTLWLATTGSNAASILPEAAAAPPEDGQWVMPSKNYANTRYSALDAINTQNVANHGH